MIRAIIVEDEISARRTLKGYIKKYFPEVQVAREVDNINDAIISLKKEDVDIVFLDVQLKDGIGLKVLENIDSSKYRIIFTTAHTEFALEAFKHKAFGYLIKPIDPYEFEEIMNRVVKSILTPPVRNRMIKLPVLNGSKWVDLNDIVHCESQSNYTKVHFINDSKPMTLSRTLKYVEEKIIQSSQFIRIHQSHLVNIRYLKNYEIRNYEIELTNGISLPVSRQKKASIVDYFNSLSD